MAHIHKLIDFVVVVLVVYENKVLLVNHKELGKWLPIGGHIELDEDPEEAVYREVKEESGLDVEIIGEKPSIKREGIKILYSPAFLDIHKINESHRHIGMVYFAKAKTSEIKLADKEHYEIKWFIEKELSDPKYNLQPDVQFYAKEALKKTSE